MNGLSLALTLAVPVVLGTLGILALVFFLLGRARGPAAELGAERVARRYPGVAVRKLEPMASCFGVESAGVWQIRGAGVLALTDAHLWFSMYLVAKEVEIPLDAIREVTLVDSHLRKRQLGRKLLKVSFERDGQADSVAWLVPDPERWLEFLGQTTKGSHRL